MCSDRGLECVTLRSYFTIHKGPSINYVVSVEGGDGSKPKDDLLNRPYLIIRQQVGERGRDKSAPNNSNETHTLMCLGRARHFGQH